MPTVVELRCRLRRYGLPVSGVKMVLIQRITKARIQEYEKRMLPAITRRFAGAVHRGPNGRELAEVERHLKEADAATIASVYEKRLRRNP